MCFFCWLDIAIKYVIIKVIDMIKMTFIELILLGLATWRITSLLCNEDGPFGIFRKLREKLGIVHYDDGQAMEYPNNFFGELFGCVWCLSVWVAGGLLLAYIFLPTLAIYFSIWLSLSTISIMVNDGLLR